MSSPVGRVPSVLLFSMTASCTSLAFEPAGPDAAPDPSELGPFAVGVRTVVFEDPKRKKPDGTPRRIVTEIWYPAIDDGGAPESYDLLTFVPDEVKPQFDGVDLGVLATTAVRDARMDEDHGPYPVVLFSHGNAAIRVQSTFFTVPLASHGYVVMSPDHEGNTLMDTESLRGPDGRLVIDYGNLLESLFDRPKDLSFLLDRLEHDKDEVAKIADLGRVGASGHSFGAVTTLRSGALEPRLDALVPMAPGAYLISWLDIETPLDDLDQPVMLHGGGLDATTEPIAVDSVWEHVTKPGQYLQLPTAGHFTYTDFCELDQEAIKAATEYGLGDILEDGCGDDNLEAQEAYRVVNNFSIGLFNRWLRDSPGTDRFLTRDRAAALTTNPRFETR
jgi:predicted dienelactone hydrolase